MGFSVILDIVLAQMGCLALRIGIVYHGSIHTAFPFGVGTV